LVAELLAEHRLLYESQEKLISHLFQFRDRMAPREVDHLQHHEFADSSASLAVYLRASVTLTEADLYPSAFAVLRSALEHQALDQLYFLADRYTELVAGVDEETFQDWKAKLANGELSPDIIRIDRAGRVNAEITRTGIHFQGEGRGVGHPTLSIFYHVLEDYDPFVPRPTAQPWLVGSFIQSLETRVERARQNATVWRENLRWERLRKNLALNGFYDERELARWDVHHGFLSAFVHPTPRAVKSAWGRMGPPEYDHYSSELVLLYATVLACLELDALTEMSRRKPILPLRRWDEVQSDVETAKKLTAYFWFPRGSPHDFDRIEEANRRGIRKGQLVHPEERIKPQELSDHDVRYYENPLRRLVKMHANIDELTGFPYRSPWLRPDAWTRTLSS
jgi:hypothetical protein